MTLEIPNALSFFRLSCGRWKSQRSQHHLLHRRAEAGSSFIVVEELSKSDERLAEIAKCNGEAVSRLIGGCRVRWSGSMAWDRVGESHQDQTMFGLIPTDDAGRHGLLLRDRGYAEKTPVAGQFHMDDENGLILATNYEMMSSLERFWFAGPNLRLRTSTVQGLSNNASFCMETRQLDKGFEAPIPPSSSASSLAPFGW
ncbi:phycobiliprotein lyase [Synechococcus sp. M16CYN]|uniref:phycobiliprotein lyase n=1 Tax=Synechococcus sp. M16CYN TaxID=3103139 RepID=UPI003246E707